MYMSYFVRMEKVIRIQGGCISDWVSSLFRTRRVVDRVADPMFLHGSGSGFQISLDPDPVSAQILEQKKIAERSLKVIYQKKT